MVNAGPVRDYTSETIPLLGWVGEQPSHPKPRKITYALLHAEGVQVGWIAQDVEEADQVYAFLCHESPRMEGGIM